jgi:hypothetical protein
LEVVLVEVWFTSFAESTKTAESTSIRTRFTHPGILITKAARITRLLTQSGYGKNSDKLLGFAFKTQVIGTVLTAIDFTSNASRAISCQLETSLAFSTVFERIASGTCCGAGFAFALVWIFIVNEVEFSTFVHTGIDCKSNEQLSFTQSTYTILADFAR